MITIKSAIVAIALSALAASAQQLPHLRVSDNQHFLVTESGKPFFYMADTGWELFHRLDREQAIQYLDTRASQKFNVIQAVALAEIDGITVPNAYGKLPLVGQDPAKPDLSKGSYWEHVDFIVDQANKRGIYIAMLPTWASWVNRDEHNRRIFTPEDAQVYGEFLGRRFGSKGVIWILGGDRPATGYEQVWRALARGIAIGVAGKEDYSSVLMSFHPPGTQSSSTWFHSDPWLDFNMQQDGHNPPAQSRSWDKIAADYARTPTKPVIDGEPLYEDHPLAFRASELGYSFDAHVRQYVYSDTFAGACGVTYGNHAVWQMYAPGRGPINGPLMYWFQAIHRPGANQMQFLRALLESRPYLSRVPDQSLVVNALEGADHITATRGDGYLFVYSAQGRKFTLRLAKNSGDNISGDKISGDKLKAWWFNPRSGSSLEAGLFDNRGELTFVPPSQGFGSDWVLVLDDVSKNFPGPGKSR